MFLAVGFLYGFNMSISKRLALIFFLHSKLKSLILISPTHFQRRTQPPGESSHKRESRGKATSTGCRTAASPREREGKRSTGKAEEEQGNWPGAEGVGAKRRWRASVGLPKGRKVTVDRPLQRNFKEFLLTAGDHFADASNMVASGDGEVQLAALHVFAVSLWLRGAGCIVCPAFTTPDVRRFTYTGRG